MLGVPVGLKRDVALLHGLLYHGHLWISNFKIHAVMDAQDELRANRVGSLALGVDAFLRHLRRHFLEQRLVLRLPLLVRHLGTNSRFRTVIVVTLAPNESLYARGTNYFQKVARISRGISSTFASARDLLENVMIRYEVTRYCLEAEGK